MAQRHDFDTPWKEVLESYFPEFMAFFFPEVYAAIDWTRTPVFLDKELQLRIYIALLTGCSSFLRIWMPWSGNK